jgi:hypothetical protein
MSGIYSLWAAMKRLAAAFNGFAAEVEAMTAEVQARRLGNDTEVVIDGGKLEAPAGNGRRKAVADAR